MISATWNDAHGWLNGLRKTPTHFLQGLNPAAKLLSEARRIAVNIAKLPELLRKPEA